MKGQRQTGSTRYGYSACENWGDREVRKEGILNTDICCAISSLGHTDYLVIADPGLPIPDHVTVIDISLVKGVPGFTEVFDAVTGELVIDSYIYAEEMESSGAELLKYVQDRCAGTKNPP